jgi:phenylpropionate dioxygenase-like ring-hydroxylating dioxygenase large terminal subunit
LKIKNSHRQTHINPQAPANSLEAKQPDLNLGTECYGTDGYFDLQSIALEFQKLWSKSWLLAGVTSDLAELGDYFLFDIQHESIIVTRSKKGIQAFYNVCSHRGAVLVTEPRGNQKVFVCPFHRWTFRNSGDLVRITDEDTFDPRVVGHRPGLTKVACETHAGLIFISMADDPPPLKEAIGLPDGYLEPYQIDKMKVVRHVRSEWGSNWKVGVEAFYESYHLHAVHPETTGMMGDLNVQYDLYPAGASRMIVPLGQPSPRLHDQTTVNEGLQFLLGEAGIDPTTFKGDAGDVRGAIQSAKRERAEREGLDYSGFVDGQLSDSWATGIFPNAQIGCHPEALFLMRFMPHISDPQRFYYDTMTLIMPTGDADATAPQWMGLPEGTDISGRQRPTTENYSLKEDANLGLVLSQDAAFLPRVQQGMRSKGFTGQLWGEQEQRLRHFHVELRRRLELD